MRAFCCLGGKFYKFFWRKFGVMTYCLAKLRGDLRLTKSYQAEWQVRASRNEYPD